MELEVAKYIGAVGSLLMVLSVMPIAGPYLFIMGAILVLIGIRAYSDASGAPGVFRNVMIAVLLAIVGSTLALVLGVMGAMIAFSSMTINPMRLSSALVLSVLGVIIAIWSIAIIASIFVRRGFSRLASLTGVKLFDTTALLYLIGSLLAIVLVGFVVIWVGFVLQTVAFFSLKGVQKTPTSLEETS